MNLVKEKQGGPVPPGLKRWTFKLIKHFAETTRVSPSPSGPAGCCPLNFLNLIKLKYQNQQKIQSLFYEIVIVAETPVDESDPHKLLLICQKHICWVKFQLFFLHHYRLHIGSGVLLRT